MKLKLLVSMYFAVILFCVDIIGCGDPPETTNNKGPVLQCAEDVSYVGDCTDKLGRFYYTDGWVAAVCSPSLERECWIGVPLRMCVVSCTTSHNELGNQWMEEQDQ